MSWNERSSNAMFDTRGRAGHALARTSARLFRRRPHPRREGSDQKGGLLLAERLKERARIARELHDTLLQGFLGASLQLQYALEQVPADSPGLPSVSYAAQLVRRVTDEGRRVLEGLRSSSTGHTSLEEAFSGLRDEFTAGRARLRIFITGRSKPLKTAVQEQIYLIAREALMNALRHSGATDIEAEVEYAPRRLRVMVRDNGCGMDSHVIRSGRPAHWGLLGMRERARSIGAQLRIWSRHGAGTEVEISIHGQTLTQAYA
jgi:signal transduction histidine kinase